MKDKTLMPKIIDEDVTSIVLRKLLPKFYGRKLLNVVQKRGSCHFGVPGAPYFPHFHKGSII
jgi:hypothetical protein